MNGISITFSAAMMFAVFAFTVVALFVRSATPTEPDLEIETDSAPGLEVA